MTLYFKTLKAAQDHVNTTYPDVKLWQQIPVVKNEYGIITIQYGAVEFWQVGEGEWYYGY